MIDFGGNPRKYKNGERARKGRRKQKQPIRRIKESPLALFPDYEALTDTEFREGIRECICGEKIPANNNATSCSWCIDYARQVDEELGQPEPGAIAEPEFPNGVYWESRGLG